MSDFHADNFNPAALREGDWIWIRGGRAVTGIPGQRSDLAEVLDASPGDWITVRYHRSGRVCDRLRAHVVRKSSITTTWRGGVQ